MAENLRVEEWNKLAKQDELGLLKDESSETNRKIKAVMRFKNAELEELAPLITKDALTNLNNRRAYDSEFPNTVENILRTGKPVSFLMLDIDFFKKVNDTYGHSKGDRVLQELSERIQKNLGRANDKFFRLGGEEFCIILENTDEEGAQKVCEKIRNAIISEKIADIDITVSIGYTSYQPKIFGKDFKNNHISAVKIAEYKKTILEYLPKIADTALYTAKKTGRNQSIFQAMPNLPLDQIKINSSQIFSNRQKQEFFQEASQYLN